MKRKLGAVPKVLLLIAATGLVVVLFTPIWRIDLVAPQYPEGLYMQIHANGLQGNVDIINGLNHYIGMKTLHNEDFIEFKLLPYIIGFFAVFFILVALLGNRRWLHILLFSFLAFGILAMYDFWRWEYDYGHDLDPSAAIQVPGMAYQPPLIGFKQLLNFGAYSFPDTGGWIFIGAGVLLLIAVYLEWRSLKTVRVRTLSLLFLLPAVMQGCSAGPEPIVAGKDHCDFCKMTITAPRYAAELVTRKGRVYKFDDIHCLLQYKAIAALLPSDVQGYYLADYTGSNTLLKAEDSFLFRSEELRTPMNGQVIAFGHRDSLQAVAARLKGEILTWQQLMK